MLFCESIYDDVAYASQVPDSEYHLETAMGLFDLSDFELVWERAMDTKCLMAWNSKTHVAVLAFRGTASMANVLADLQVMVGRSTPRAQLYAPLSPFRGCPDVLPRWPRPCRTCTV